jgi:hypothetical protein
VKCVLLSSCTTGIKYMWKSFILGRSIFAGMTKKARNGSASHIQGGAKCWEPNACSIA